MHGVVQKFLLHAGILIPLHPASLMHKNPQRCKIIVVDGMHPIGHKEQSIHLTHWLWTGMDSRSFTRRVPGFTIPICNKITVHVARTVNKHLITKSIILSHPFSIPLPIPGRKAIFSRLYHFLQLCLATFLSFEHR